MNKKEIKALVAFSWGLDSLLAIKVLEDQWIKCTALTFESPFFSADKSRKQCEKYWIDLKVINFSEDHFEIVKNPANWYWKNMNPCIDCHWFMFWEMAKIAEKEWYDIIASWEVLWQRPMSQNKNSLAKVKKIAWKDVLRPLSAKLMEETEYERKWLVDREKLLDFSWRSRKRQFELAKKFWLEDYESPWWWCLLTTIEYSKKLKNYIENFWEWAKFFDAEFLKFWRDRIFSDWDKKFFAVMWRNQDDNKKIFEKFIQSNKNYFLIKMKDFSGPTVVVNSFWNKITEKILDEIWEWFKEKVKKVREQVWDWKVELNIIEFNK